MSSLFSIKKLTNLVFIGGILLTAGCDAAPTNQQIDTKPTLVETTDREPFKVNYALSLYTSAQDDFDPSSRTKNQTLDRALVRQRARNYIEGWNTRNLEGVTARLTPELAANGTYSDPGETAHGVDEVAATAMQMHDALGGLIRRFVIAGEPELIEHTSGLFYNVENLLVYNWDWQQDGQSVLHGKELTLFNDDQMIHYDMGIFSTASFPHFEPVGGAAVDNMEATLDGYLSKLNALTGPEKYEIIKAALTHPASKINGDHSETLTTLKSADLDTAKFARNGAASFTQISIAYPWALKSGGSTLMEGLEVNVFDESGNVKYAFGFSGN